MRVLVVVDMQNDFVSGSLGSNEAKQIVPRVAEKIAAFDGQIIATMDSHGEDYLGTQEGKILPVEHCIYGTDGWELDAAVEEALSHIDDGFITICKPTFGSTELGEYLVSLHENSIDSPIEEVVLVGLCTDICVVSNALLIKAFLPEVKITVDAACCAGVTSAAHQAALQTMRSCQINIENWES